jgi:hypothetical protein
MRIGFPGTGTAGRHLRPEVAGPEHEVPPEPDMMDQDTAELAYRRGAGIEVTLLWHRTSGELTVSVTDAASGASFELPVAADEALAAFHHPYAYAAARAPRQGFRGEQVIPRIVRKNLNDPNGPWCYGPRAKEPGSGPTPCGITQAQQLTSG